jgi:hypothetical protein
MTDDGAGFTGSPHPRALDQAAPEVFDHTANPADSPIFSRSPLLCSSVGAFLSQSVLDHGGSQIARN